MSAPHHEPVSDSPGVNDRDDPDERVRTEAAEALEKLAGTYEFASDARWPVAAAQTWHPTRRTVPDLETTR